MDRSVAETADDADSYTHGAQVINAYFSWCYPCLSLVPRGYNHLRTIVFGVYFLRLTFKQHTKLFGAHSAPYGQKLTMQAQQTHINSTFVPSRYFI